LNTHKSISVRPRHPLFSRQYVTALLFVVLLLPLRFAWAGKSDLDKQLKSDYSGKTLTLRRFYSGEHLKFRSDGRLQGDAPIGPWTLDGQIEVEDVHLHRTQLVIKGRRIYLSFDSRRKSQDKSMTTNNNHGKPFKGLEKTLSSIQVEIEIELPDDKPDPKDVSSAIQAVFVSGSESMLDIVPSYWRAYFAKQEGRPQSPPESKELVYNVKPKSGVTAPHPIHTPDPEYSPEARKLKHQGTVVMSLVVDASGAARDLQIQRPLGLGLDEMAVEAVSGWKFDPAQKDGKPVPVVLYVEVNFHLY